jgi:hypothetical protein
LRVTLTHHDLPHLFATRCIETGVGIPTVSPLYRAKAKGRRRMSPPQRRRRFGDFAACRAVASDAKAGHLRNQHSASMAKLVNFAPTDSNIIPLTEPKAEPPKRDNKVRSA